MEFKAVQCVTDVPHMVRYHWWSMLVLLNERYKMAASLGYENLRFGLVSVLDLEGFGLKSMGKEKREAGTHTRSPHRTGTAAPGQLAGRTYMGRRGQVNCWLAHAGADAGCLPWCYGLSWSCSSWCSAGEIYSYIKEVGGLHPSRLARLIHPLQRSLN